MLVYVPNSIEENPSCEDDSRSSGQETPWLIQQDCEWRNSGRSLQILPSLFIYDNVISAHGSPENVTSFRH
jgi:hypothetical protein